MLGTEQMYENFKSEITICLASAMLFLQDMAHKDQSAAHERTGGTLKTDQNSNNGMFSNLLPRKNKN